MSTSIWRIIDTTGLRTFSVLRFYVRKIVLAAIGCGMASISAMYIRITGRQSWGRAMMAGLERGRHHGPAGGRYFT